MYMIAGLGNPGKEYNNTRHNIGFAFIDALAQEYDINVMDVKLKALTGKGMIGGQKVLLVKPLTFMNLSGESIRPLADYYKVDPESELIVVSDDITLSPGGIRIRKKGSAGGHNGLKNIIGQLGTENFKRIRIGVGEKPKGYDLADYVLGHFKDDEKELLSDALDKVEKAAELFAQDEFAEAMNKYSVGKKKRKTLE